MTAELTLTNNGVVPVDVEVDYLPSGTSLETIVEEWPDEWRQGDAVPTDANFVVGFPEYPNSVQPGETFIGTFVLAIPRMHTFVCWIGGTSAAVQETAVATTGMMVIDEA